MEIFKKLILFVLVAMSAAAGMAKVLQLPHEASFFEQAGLGFSALIILGLIQVSGSILALIPQTRKWGLALIGLGFFLSVIIIFLAGQTTFALISLIPVVLADWLLFDAFRKARRQ